LAGSKHLSKPTERAPDLSASLTRLILLPYAVRADLGLVERVVLRTRRTVISAASASPIVHDCPGETAGEQRKPLRRKLDCSRFKDRPSGRHLPGGTYCAVSRVVSQMPTGRVCGAARGDDRVHGCWPSGSV